MVASGGGAPWCWALVLKYGKENIEKTNRAEPKTRIEAIPLFKLVDNISITNL